MYSGEAKQISVLLDTVQMRGVLEKYVVPDEQVTSCHILQTRYKPGKNCTVSYAIATSARDRMAYLRVYEPGGSLSRYRRALEEGQDVRHVPDLNGVAWVFPSDRKLKGLPALMDESILGSETLPALIASSRGPGFVLRSFSSRTVHYVAEHACTVRVQLRCSAPDGSAEKQAAFYGKTHYDEQGASTFRLMEQLSAGKAGARKLPLIPRPILYQPEWATLWQEEMPGSVLDTSDISQLRRAAESLARLHGTAVCGLPRRSPMNARLQTALEFILQTGWAGRFGVAQLVKDLMSLSALLTPRPSVTLHGDVHPKNLLVTDSDVGLIDLDTVAAGDPLDDIGGFAAGLYVRCQAQGVCPDDIDRRVREFVGAYRRSFTCSIPELDLSWHISAALITERLCRAITRVKNTSLSPDLVLALARIFGHRAANLTAGEEATA